MIRYEGLNVFVECPECRILMEVYPNSFKDREIEHITCGATGDVNRQRGDSRGCGTLFGLKMTLEAHFNVYRMEKVPDAVAA